MQLDGFPTYRVAVDVGTKRKPSLLQARIAKHRSKICSLVTGNGDSLRILKNSSVSYKQTNKQKSFVFPTGLIELFKSYLLFMANHHTVYIS
jgi:hypothetical protein